MKLNERTADLCARKIIAAAFCYYVLDDPIMSDARYDKLSRFVARYWNYLEPDQQWALGSARDTRNGGSHIKFSVRAFYGVLFVYRKKKKRPNFELMVRRWRKTNKGRRYVTTADF